MITLIRRFLAWIGDLFLFNVQARLIAHMTDLDDSLIELRQTIQYERSRPKLSPLRSR
jgi:hypothetical protein